jgi:hypothetical protein
MAIIDKDVKAIIDTNRDTTPFIQQAELLVSELLSGVSLSPARKDFIIKYIAAHFVWVTETSSLVAKDIGSTKEVYRTYADKSSGLMSSRYGQSAIMLDPSGLLAAVAAGGGIKALFSVIAQHGNPPAGWPGWTEFPQ